MIFWLHHKIFLVFCFRFDEFSLQTWIFCMSTLFISPQSMQTYLVLTQLSFRDFFFFFWNQTRKDSWETSGIAWLMVLYYRFLFCASSILLLTVKWAYQRISHVSICTDVQVRTYVLLLSFTTVKHFSSLEKMTFRWCHSTHLWEINILTY